MSDCDRSPRFLAGSTLGADGSSLATPRTVLQQLKAASGDVERILSLVKEAERGHEDLRSLAEVYGVAVDFYGQPQSAQDYEYRDLCVKRMRALCRTSPAEAREFHNRLRTYTAGRADARMYEARAAMEERLGDTAKAVKMLQEGLKVGAQPAEVLQRVLGRLQPQAQGQQLAPSQQPATPQAQASPRAAVAAAAPAFPATPRAAVPLSGLATALRRPPRILGLGSPMRNSPSDAEAGGEEGTAESSGSDSGDSGGAAAAAPAAAGAASGAGLRARGVSESHTAASMSIMRLSPIREAESLDDVSGSHGSSERRSRGELRGGEARRGSVESSSGEAWGSEAGGATPRAAAAGSTPAARRVPAASSEVAEVASRDGEAPPEAAPAVPSSPKTTGGQESPRKVQKVVYVNGIAYSQVRTLGRGGSSKVYLVEDPHGEVLALKRVVADNAKQLEAFQNEVILLQQLREQEHVIQVVDAEIDREKGRINIVMEAGDMDLGSFLRSEPGLGIPQIQDLWRQMLEAVQVIHNERIVHSDLKPGNFLLVGGRLKVIDFGIAKRISNDTTNIHRDASVGTLSYMAPEAIKQGHLKIGRASDIWSLGIILYQMVYGQPPFAALEPWQRMLKLTDPGLAIQLPEGRRLETCSPGTREQLLEALGRCLQRDPRRRPSLEELLGHPFLRTRLEVRREALDGAVGALMADVLRTVSATLRPQAPPPQLEDAAWRGLTDELWQRLAKAEGAEGEGATPGLRGLAPLEDQLRQILAEPCQRQEDGRGRQPLRALTMSTSAENVALGEAENAGGCQQAQKQQQKRPTAPLGAARMENWKENAGAGWSCSQQQEMAVRPGQVAEAKERLMRRGLRGP